MIELPERFVAGNQPREVSTKFGIPRGERRVDEAGEHSLILFLESGKAGLQTIVQFKRVAAAFGDGDYEVELLLFARAKLHFEDQHSFVFSSIGCRMKTLCRGNLRMLRLKQETASLGMPSDSVVGFPRRIHEPRRRFPGDAASHIEGKCKATLRAAQILHCDGLHYGAAFVGEEHASRKLQSVGGLRPNHTMRKPLIVNISVGRTGDGEKSAIQEEFAGQEIARTPGGLGDAATSIGRKRDGGDRGNRFPHLRVAKLIHRHRTVE